MESLKDRAIKFLTIDKLSVIPVRKDKIPCIAWKEYQKRFATVQEIEDWWQKYPDAQIGICTGELSNLTVVDIEEGGDPSFLPQDTFIVKTGGNGWHYYYRFQEGMQNKARIRPLVDIRSEGGYVVAPYSSSEKGSYEVIKSRPPTSFPKELFNTPVETSESVVSHTTHIPGDAEIISDSFFLLSSYSGYGKGQRNEEMTSFIGKVLTRINPVHWDTHGFDIICKANAKNTPPLAINELLTSFRSIKGRETAKTPVHTNSATPGAHGAFVMPPPDGSDDIKHISVVAEEQSINQEEVYPLEMPIFDDVLDGGINLGDIIIIAAPTGHGKTSLAQDWTMSFIRGKQKAPVVWFSYEVMTRYLWKKFQSMGMTTEDIAVIPAKHTSGNVAWVEAKVREAKEKFNVKIVVIDHLGFLLPKTMGMLGQKMSMNQSSFITQIVRDLKSIAISKEVAIILPVHMRKTNSGSVDQESIKDSSGIAQEADAVFLVERERNKNTDQDNQYYTEYSKITLSKNRKNGVTPSGWFTMINQRFAFSDRNEQIKRVEEVFSAFRGVEDDDPQDI